MWWRNGILTAIVMMCACTTVNARDWQLSGDVRAELRSFLESARHPSQFDSRVQASVELSPEWRLRDGVNQFTVAPFLRLDAEDDERSHIDVREAYWSHRGDEFDVLIGINKVFWGVTESRHLVDIINQDDAVENIDGEDKLGQPMINVAVPRDWGTIDLFVLPGFRERTFAGDKGRLRFALPVDDHAAKYESGAEEWHTDFAAHYSHSLGDWDIGTHYFYGTGREPRLIPNSTGTALRPFYDLIHQVGVDVQYTHEAWLWKFEGLVREGQGDTFGAFVGGFEYTLYQIQDSAADLGLLVEYLYDDRDKDPTQAPGTFFGNDMFLGARLALNDTQDTELLAGLITDTDDQSSLLFIEGERRLSERWSLEAEVQIFLNTDRTNPLSSFDDDSFITLRLSRFF